jgi:hypothetical protein
MAVIIHSSLSYFFVPITQRLIKEIIIIQSQHLMFTHYIEEHTVWYVGTFRICLKTVQKMLLLTQELQSILID